MNFNCFGFSLTNEGESYVVENVEKFEAKEESPF